ncbi:MULTISPECIES: hypothetical protein [Neisseria]|uniref:hypothetical protein n=1 Tax=Neisseria TaxID=482 RepID=UPI0015D55475|nr:MULTISPECIES: hypothetical protein [Neisseria]
MCRLKGGRLLRGVPCGTELIGAFRRILRGIVVEKNGAGQVGTLYADGDIYS